MLVGNFRVVHPVFFPPPLTTWEGFTTMVGNVELMPHIIASLTVWTIGFSIAVIAGTLLGLIVGTSVPVDKLGGPLLWAIYATPWLAYRPLSVAWFGFGKTPIIFLIIIAAIFPVLLNTSAGIRQTDKSLIRAARIFGGSRTDVFRKVLLPATLPYTLTGIRQAVILATVAMTVAELTGPSLGVGALVILKANNYLTGQSFAAIAMLAIWSISMSQLIRVVSRRIAPWATQGHG